MLIQHKMLKKQEDDKNCQSIKNVKSKYDDFDSHSTVLKCSDKKCQEKNCYAASEAPSGCPVKGTSKAI